MDAVIVVKLFYRQLTPSVARSFIVNQGASTCIVHGVRVHSYLRLVRDHDGKSSDTG
jgi:hypothetical protein